MQYFVGGQAFTAPLDQASQTAPIPPNCPTHHTCLSGYRAILVLALACLIAGCTVFPNASVATPTATAPVGTYDTFVATNGMMFGFDAAHTHFNPYEHILNSANVSRLVPAWAYPSVGLIGTSPVVANGTVYVGSVDKSLYALDAHSGKKLWSFAAEGAIYSAPAVANGVVYVGSDDHSLYALDAHSGKKLWSFATGNIILQSSPAVANGVVYVGSRDTSLYALDAHSGRKLWSFATGLGVDSSPTIANGVVYFGSRDTFLYALDARSSSKLWSFATGGFITSAPAVANGVVYVGSWGGKVYAFRLPS